MKRLGIVFFIALVLYLFTGLTTIRPDERGLVRRFGKVVATPGPGLWVGLPMGFDRVDRVSVSSVRQCQIGTDEEPATFITGDHNVITAAVTVGYSVDAQKLDRFVVHQSMIDTALANTVQNLLAEWAASVRIDDVLLNGRTRLTDELVRLLPTRLKAMDMGIVVQQIGVKALGPPEDVRDAFTQVNETQAAMQTAENKARQDASRRLREAETIALTLATQAESGRIEKLSAATADAETFRIRLAQFRKMQMATPNALAAIWWDETGRLLLGMKGKGRIDLLDSHLGPNGLDLSTIHAPKRTP